MASSPIKKDTEWKSLIYIKETPVTNVSISANSHKNVTFSVPSVNGYKPVLAVYRNNNASYDIVPVDASSVVLDASATSFNLTVRNVASSAVTTIVRANIIYTKQ